MLFYGNMLKYKKYEQADSLITLPDMGENLKTKKILFSGYVTKKYLLPTSGIQIAALVGADGDITAVSYSDDYTEEGLTAIENLVQETRESNLTIVFVPTQKNIFNYRAGYDARYNHVILAGSSLTRPDTGEKFGTVIFAIPESDIFSTYSNVKLGTTGEIFICDEEGNLISSGDIKKLDSMKVDDEYLNIIKDSGTGIRYLNENGKQVMAVIKPLYGTEWLVAGRVPVNELSENVNVLISLTLIMIAAGIIISLIFISFLVESIVKPVRQIICAMNEAENGNLDVSVEVSGEYEISEIAKYFNSMIAKIRKLIEDEYVIERKKKEAEMNVLMGQINPHFLYNTLESIVWKAQMIGETQISEMAASLGRLYRLSVNKGVLYVKVSEELEHVKAYVDIQKFRYKDKFDCGILVKDKSLLDDLTLKMMLQPIVENSIVYCVEPTSSFVRIAIEVDKSGNNLVFSVKDDGVGMSRDKVEKLQQKINDFTEEEPKTNGTKPRHHRGIGLKNINERIKLYFGNDYGISIESQKGVGTRVTVTVPVIDSDAQSHLQ